MYEREMVMVAVVLLVPDHSGNDVIGHAQARQLIRPQLLGQAEHGASVDLLTQPRSLLDGNIYI